MGAQATAVAAVQNTAVYSGVCTLRGFFIHSTAGADVVIYDGVSAAGVVLAQFTLAAKGSMAVDVAGGVRCTTGIYVSSSAAVQGHVRVG